MYQPALFESRSESINERLERAAGCGRLFYSVSQAAELLEISVFMARYRIEMYRLDALLINGQYRIPYTAIIDSINSSKLIANQWYSMLALQRLINDNGYKRAMHPFQNYDLMEGKEADLQDWYDLHKLPLPTEASVSRWAMILGIKTDVLCQENGYKLDKQIAWPEIYDFLIEHEVINLPCPFYEKQQIPEPEDDMQPSLFE